MSAPDRTSHYGHPAMTLAAGLAFVLLGAALLLQELGLLAVSWSVVVPGVLVAAGLTMAGAGVVGAHRSRGNHTWTR
jgi:hypothetical protein